MWHPLFAAMLRHHLGTAYTLEEEKSVGVMPLRIDVVLLRRGSGDLSEYARRVLAGLCEYFNETTILDYKGPTDALQAGDAQQLLSYLWLYRTQTEALLPPSRLSLLVVAPRLTGPYLDELTLLGADATEVDPGVWQIDGRLFGGHGVRLVETARLGDRHHPLLSVIGPAIVRNAATTHDNLVADGYTALLSFMLQCQATTRSPGSEPAMRYELPQEYLQAMREVMQRLPPEDRLYGLPAEERLRGLPPEDRLRGLSPDDILQGLSPEEIARLRERLNRTPDATP